MAAGDRNKAGKPKDIVKHFSNDTLPVCGTKGFGYRTNDISDVTCLKCRRKIIVDNIWYPSK